MTARAPNPRADGPVGTEGNRQATGRVQSSMDSTPLSVRSAPLTDLSAGLDDTGATLTRIPAVTGLGTADATAMALGLIACDLVATLVRLAVENHRATTDAGEAVSRIAEATSVSAQAYRRTDDDAARHLRTAETPA